MKYEFCGYSTEQEGKVNIEEHFNEVCNDEGGVFLISKKEFKHEEEDLVFAYKYGISIIDMRNDTSKGNKGVYIALELIPSYNDLHETIKKQVLEDYSYCGDYADEIDNDSKYYDLLSEGFSVRMGFETVLTNANIDINPYELMELDKVVYVVKSITQIYSVVDRLRGFNLDKAWNMIGTNGWDTLQNAINGTKLFNF